MLSRPPCAQAYFLNKALVINFNFHVNDNAIYDFHANYIALFIAEYANIDASATVSRCNSHKVFTSMVNQHLY